MDLGKFFFVALTISRENSGVGVTANVAETTRRKSVDLRVDKGSDLSVGVRGLAYGGGADADTTTAGVECSCGDVRVRENANNSLLLGPLEDTCGFGSLAEAVGEVDDAWSGGIERGELASAWTSQRETSA